MAGAAGGRSSLEKQRSEAYIRGSWDISKIEAAFTAAAVNSSLWDQAMEIVAEVIPCVGAGLVPVHTHFPRMPHSEGVARLAHEYLNGPWHSRDQRYRALPKISRVGVGTDLDFATPDDLARNPFYQEFLGPLGCPWFAGVKVGADGDFRCLTLQRSSSHGPFSPKELEVLAKLSHALSGPAALAKALNSARAEAALSSFEASGTPIILLDKHANVGGLNPSADRLLGEDVKIVARRLTSWAPSITSQLDKSISSLFLSLWPRAAMPPVVMPRIDPARRPLLAYAMRISGVTADVFGACRGIIVLLDLERQGSPAEDALRQVFSLTPTEAKLARQLSLGASVEEAAELLGIGRETARGHLKAIFSKTDTHRQGELVLLLARLFDYGA